MPYPQRERLHRPCLVLINRVIAWRAHGDAASFPKRDGTFCTCVRISSTFPSSIHRLLVVYPVNHHLQAHSVNSPPSIRQPRRRTDARESYCLPKGGRYQREADELHNFVLREESGACRPCTSTTSFISALRRRHTRKSSQEPLAPPYKL